MTEPHIKHNSILIILTRFQFARKTIKYLLHFSTKAHRSTLSLGSPVLFNTQGINNNFTKVYLWHPEKFSGWCLVYIIHRVAIAPRDSAQHSYEKLLIQIRLRTHKRHTELTHNSSCCIETVLYIMNRWSQSSSDKRMCFTTLLRSNR